MAGMKNRIELVPGKIRTVRVGEAHREGGLDFVELHPADHPRVQVFNKGPNLLNQSPSLSGALPIAVKDEPGAARD